MAKDKKDKKDKKSGDEPGGQDNRVRLATHPRAGRQIAAAKSWGGLLGFVFVGYFSYGAGSTVFEAGLRALAGGIGFYVLAWAGAVVVWREVAVAEVERARRRAQAEAEVLAAAAEAAASPKSAAA